MVVRNVIRLKSFQQNIAVEPRKRNNSLFERELRVVELIGIEPTTY